ncbi:MAG: chorismate lyase [Gammaproteobacteria bacterium]|jgi:chorismate--pyruvate lyase|nr:chorismate lyase [Gammaproteobacteria bacterium]
MMRKRIERSWKIQHSEVPLPWRTWVLHTGSFMQHLAQQGVRDAYIHVLQQRWQLPLPEERRLLGIDFRSYVLMREVVILSAASQWMFARTVILRGTLTGKEQQLAHLKSRSLGSVLFRNPALQRSKFDIAFLKRGLKWHNKVTKAVKLTLPDLWARRSLFSLCGKTLLLTEVFLPDLATL